MSKTKQPPPTVVVIFGAGGDLTWRKLIPAFFHLYQDGWLSEQFIVIGVDLKQMTEDEYRDHLRRGCDQACRPGTTFDDAAWQNFAKHISYRPADLSNLKTYQDLLTFCHRREAEWESQVQRLFYLAISPTLIGPVCEKLDAAGFAADVENTRVIIEKPFGRDLVSATALNKTITRSFDESQIYRIDHYLGKETVQNILAFRFANSLFEPVWNRRYTDHVQVTVAETVGVEHRGGYYEQAGALRDMVQNHLLQLLALITMEPIVSFAPDEIRNKKVDALRAIRPMTIEEVDRFVVRGQYGAGWMEGQKVPAYCAEPGVDKDSTTETFVAAKFYFDNWRWQDVPFYIRTGKRLPARTSEIVMQFRPVPHLAFPSAAARDLLPNALIMRIQPEEGITLRIQAKQPGQRLRLNQVEMEFNYKDSFREHQPEAYETLLLDAMLGDASLFMRADQVEAAWALMQPILDNWEASPPHSFPNYAAGTWGPETATSLLARDGRHWYGPDKLNDQ